MKRTLLITVAASLLLTVTGCEKTSSDQSSSVDITTQETEMNAWLLTIAPEEAVSITTAKANHKEGDSVVIRGRIGGRYSPISSESSVFTIVDLGLPYCGEHEEKGCSTPWDYCCETSGTITNNSATVQIVSQGSVDPIAAGLKPLDEVILVGTVGPRPNEETFTIQATGVYRTDG
ncbi:MAG: hypothetical protein P1U42_03715 [Phycisphaerales bacterium]|nr:hypothetical protein [Phycisphaerales bacterium]